MNLIELAQQETALKALMDLVGDQLKATKADMQTALEETGARSVDATLPDGTKVGTVFRSAAKATAQVTDPELFLKWAQAHAKKNVTTRLVTEVAPAYQTALLAEMTAAGTTEAADMETGEVLEVPGVEIRTGRNLTHSVRLAKGGAEAIAEAWRNGDLAHLNLPQLTQGGGEA